MSPEERADREQAERAAADEDAGMDADEKWYALHDGWVR